MGYLALVMYAAWAVLLAGLGAWGTLAAWLLFGALLVLAVALTTSPASPATYRRGRETSTRGG